MSGEFFEQIQSLLYGKLEVEFVDPTFSEQLEIVRALTANPSAVSRLRIKGVQHPWIIQLLSGFEAAAQTERAAEVQQAAQTERAAEVQQAARTERAAVDQAAARTAAAQSLLFSR